MVNLGSSLVAWDPWDHQHKVSAPLRRTFSYILTTSKQTRSSYLPSGEYSGNVRHPRYNWIPRNGVTSGSDRPPGIVPLHMGSHKVSLGTSSKDIQLYLNYL